MSRLSRGELFRNAAVEAKLNKSPISSYGVEKNKSGTRDPPAICDWCCRRETKERFKVCFRCADLGISKTSKIFHYYCSKRCQVLHWKEKHRFEHIMVERLEPVIAEKMAGGEIQDISELEGFMREELSVRRVCPCPTCGNYHSDEYTPTDSDCWSDDTENYGEEDWRDCKEN